MGAISYSGTDKGHEKNSNKINRILEKGEEHQSMIHEHATKIRRSNFKNRRRRRTVD